MPKGSKKRKAEKRKKEKEAHITSPTNSVQGSEDLKSQSDSGEVSFSSSTTTTNNTSTSTNTSEERQLRSGHEVEGNKMDDDSLVVGSEAVSKSRSIERSEVGGKRKEEDGVEIIRDLKVQEEKEKHVVVTEGGDSVKRIVNIESVDSVMESSSESGSGSYSGSSSDDESEAIEKNKGDFDSVTETTPHVDLIEKAVSISEDVEIIEFTLAEKTGDSSVIDLPTKEMVQVGGDVSSCESSNGYEHRHKEDTITEISNNQPAPAPSSSENSNGYEHGYEASSPEISENQHLALAPLNNENINGSQHRDKGTTTEVSNNQQAASAPLSSVVSGRYEHHTKTTTPEISDKMQQTAVVPPTVQPTSWKSCCGLFDVFMGSNR